MSTRKSQTVNLLETLGLSDVLSLTTSFTSTLTESLTFSDDNTFAGTLKIRSVKHSQLLGGVSFTITPNPLTGTGSLSITDNGANDVNATSGEIRIASVPFDDYSVVVPTAGIPAGNVITVNQTSVSVCCENANPFVQFNFHDVNDDLSVDGPETETSAPLLNSASLSTLQGFATKIVQGNTQTTLTKTSQLPPIITAGVNNSTAKATATTQQSNIKYSKTFALGTSGTTLQNTLKIPAYTLPANKSLTAVIPLAVSQESTKHQMISTPPLKKIIAGQQMILPVDKSLLPSYGGLIKAELTSKANSSSTGSVDWIAFETADQYINSQTLAQSGISNELAMIVRVTYLHEDNSTGFDWGDSSNIESAILTVNVNKPVPSDAVLLSNGCPDYEVYTLVGGKWVSGIDSIISVTPDGSTAECTVKFQSDHYSTKSISSKRTSSPGTSTSGTSGTSGGGGRTGVSGGGSGAGGFAGILGTPLTINEITYDKCDEHIARILVSSDADNPPSVVLHTTKSGTVYAKLAQVQPYEETNKITKVDRYLYEVPIASDESFLMVVVTEEKGTIQNTVQAGIRLTSCEGSTTIAEVPKGEFEEISFNVPRIFDTKFQIGDSISYRADMDSEFFYVDNQDLTVSAIIDSQIPLQRVELRTIPMTSLDEEYVAVRMNIESLPVSNSTYVVSGTVPSFFMQEPGMKYWIHVLDEGQNKSESKQYRIGVKPTSVPDVLVEMDVPTVKPTNSVIKPEIYIKNENSASYGIVSLLVDGKIVSKKAQLLNEGQTKVTLDWKVPESKLYSSNELQASVDLYDKTITTVPATVHSYPKTIATSAYDMKPLELIVRDNKVLAEPALIYASDSDENLRFRVIDPQGQCIIGSSDECVIKESTRDNRGGLVSVNYGDQILRVRYSGSDNPLERFSITSIDPITDEWVVTLETQDGMIPEAHALQDTSVKIKYRYHSEIITVKSE
jgi:hypothetical protein